MSIQRPLLLAYALAAGFAASCATTEDDGFVEVEPRGIVLEPKDCTHTQGFWKTHSIYASQPKKQIHWPIWENTTGCGDTWFSWMQQVPDEGDHWLILGHQWMTAMLNQAAGATVPTEVQDAMWAAQSLLIPCEIADEDIEEASALAETLDAYNNGLVGPALCE